MVILFCNSFTYRAPSPRDDLYLITGRDDFLFFFGFGTDRDEFSVSNLDFKSSFVAIVALLCAENLASDWTADNLSLSA